MVMPYHILFDQYEEERLGGKSFGSTKSGIAPFYSDKYAKIGFQVSELFDEDALKEKVERVCRDKERYFWSICITNRFLNPDEIYEELMKYKEDGSAICMRCISVPVECIKRRQRDPAGGTAWIPERSGSRNLSDGYIFFHTGSIWCNRSRCSAI